ncbi:MAG: NAD(P)-dependent oxidoreductase [Bacteroidota bacterium]|nr:NAD(P)-dependent oxidoreductase [Bacteroidota bacterium]
MQVLLIDDIHPILLEKLETQNIKVDYHPEYSREDIIKNIGTYEGIIVRSKVKIDKQIIDLATNLKFIARSGAGMDSIDVDYAEKKNIVCINSPEGNRDAVGEHCLGLLLSLFNKITIGNQEVRQGLWLREENRGLEIKGKTIGIIGYGNMGREFAKRLSGFDCRVLAYDKYKKNYSDKYAKEVTLEKLKEETDILSLHIPLTEETKYMVNASFINSFHKPFFLLNTARGKVVRLADLILALENKKILGAGLDVLEYENFSNEMSFDSQAQEELKHLFTMQNIVLTPHVAGWTKESYYKLSYFLAEKILYFLDQI